MTEEQTSGLIGLGQKIIGVLPAQFLALLLVNIIVVGVMVWHLDNASDARERVLKQLISSCYGRSGNHPPDEGPG
jgi:hypothetical protein